MNDLRIRSPNREVWRIAEIEFAHQLAMQTFLEFTRSHAPPDIERAIPFPFHEETRAIGDALSRNLPGVRASRRRVCGRTATRYGGKMLATTGAGLAAVFLLLGQLAPAQMQGGKAPVSETTYVFSYFVGNGEDGLHLASSRDGLKWEALNGGRSFLKPEVGESKLMRDPCLLLGPDRTFHMVWTTSWNGKTIGYANSEDLITWSRQQAIPVMAHEANALNCWAPEIAWNEKRERFLIFWATTIPGRFPETDGQGDDKYNHRMYCTTTRDFKTFTPTRLFYDPGFNVIDATLLHAEGRFHLFIKDETRHPPKKHLRIASSDDIEGPWGSLSAPFTRDWVEGPSVLKVGDDYLAYYDAYRDQRYEAKRSRNLETWEDITDRISFPRGARHGTAIAVPGEVVGKLLQSDKAESGDGTDSAVEMGSKPTVFDFGSGKVAPGCIQVLPATVYSKEQGYGFDLGSRVYAPHRDGDDALRGDFITADQPFFFSVALPEGNYHVAVTFGDAAGCTTNTVKTESRRLMLEQIITKRGEYVKRSFTVNVRMPDLAGGGQVRLKSREQGVLHWDDKLTIEFNGARPCVAGLEITPDPNAVTVFLLGDSTVTDQPREPWNSWGQMLPRFFQAGVAVANHAESGESLRSSLNARRVEKVLGSIKPGDYLFVQFGHNDMKEKGEGVGAFTTFTTNLKKLVADARARKAQPVLITSMERKAGVERATLGDYPEAVRQVAKEENVPLIDLHEMSRTLYRALGTDLNKAFQDGTHHDNFGSYELARCIVNGIRANQLGLAEFLTQDLPTFDPGRPDSPANFAVPPSPLRSEVRPDGN